MQSVKAYQLFHKSLLLIIVAKHNLLFYTSCKFIDENKVAPKLNKLYLKTLYVHISVCYHNLFAVPDFFLDHPLKV
jgi:hypothetical protein